MTVILLFASIHQVIRAEAVLGEAGIGGSMVPIPHQISTDCGMGWSLPGERVAGALATLARVELRPQAGWTKTEAGWTAVDLDSLSG